jgi:hypothetical protein
MPPNVELARQQWQEGHRRLEGPYAARGHVREQVGVLLAELRKRMGATYTLSELTAAYRAADGWAYEALAGDLTEPGWTGSIATAIDAAFHVYSRGALDYSP